MTISPEMILSKLKKEDESEFTALVSAIDDALSKMKEYHVNIHISPSFRVQEKLFKFYADAGWKIETSSSFKDEDNYWRFTIPERLLK